MIDCSFEEIERHLQSSIDDRLALAVEDIVDPFDASPLSPTESARLASQGSKRRRAEFVAGRRAVRRALAAVTAESQLATGIVIDTAPNGAPIAVGLPCAISITHTDRRAMALARSTSLPLGLDLSEHSDAARIRRVIARGFPDAEERALALTSDYALCAAWSLKEAVAKALSIGMLEGRGVERIVIKSVAPAAVTVADDPRPLRVSAFPIPGGVLATALVLR